VTAALQLKDLGSSDNADRLLMPRTELIVSLEQKRFD
jgi:hypothetical protein